MRLRLKCMQMSPATWHAQCPQPQLSLEQVIGQLKVSGFQEANALALADVIIRVAHAQGVHPLTYFDLNRNTVKFTVDAYRIVNDMRPPGSKINLVSQRNNQTSSPGRLIRP